MERVNVLKIYNIVGGVNGVGKSSLIGSLKSRLNDFGLIIDVDKINERFNGDRLKGGKYAVNLISDCISKGITFTQETTLSGVRTEKTISLAKEKGYYIRLYYIGLDNADESIDRIANRVKKGGHDIPKKDVIKRFQHRFENLEKILPYCDTAYFYDNFNGFKEVGVYKNGEIISHGNSQPDWMNELVSRQQEKVFRAFNNKQVKK